MSSAYKMIVLSTPIIKTYKIVKKLRHRDQCLEDKKMKHSTTPTAAMTIVNLIVLTKGESPSTFPKGLLVLKGTI
ncbi:hypothetical protein ACNR9Q_03050 [Maribacter sp. X9]|uniref:hypothetical protein n=1 Tax=Maribacter sp. X9 TaxID=3402159 RepID=UPI003AF38E48